MLSSRFAMKVVSPVVAVAAILLAACADGTQVSAPGDAGALASVLSPVATRTAPPPGHGLISGIPATCDNNSTLFVEIVPGGPPGSGSTWLDDGTHVIAQHVTLVYEGQVVYEKYTGVRKNGTVITCGGPFPWNGDLAQITVVSTTSP